jgi:chromosome segregation ATPase
MEYPSMSQLVPLLIGLFGGGGLATFVAVLLNGRREDRKQAFDQLSGIVADLRKRITVLEQEVCEYQDSQSADREKIGRLETGLVECRQKHDYDQREIAKLREDIHSFRNRLSSCELCHGQPILSPEKR